MAMSTMKTELRYINPLSSSLSFSLIPSNLYSASLVFQTQKRPSVCRKLAISSENSGNLRYPGFNFPAGKFESRTEGKERETHMLELDKLFLDNGEVEISDTFFEAVEELEKMVREPSDNLVEMNDRLSYREFQLVLVYFSQEGRDSWCALEVFDFLRRENRVDEETVELMVSIMCSWVEKLIEDDFDASDIIDLLKEMECVGLNPQFNMIEKVISLFWGKGKKDEAVEFVKVALRHDFGRTFLGENKQRGIGYLAWKMVADGDYRKAAGLVAEFRACGLKPETYSYLIALTALVKEQNEFSKCLRKLRKYQKDGIVAKHDIENLRHIEDYQFQLLSSAQQLSSWAFEEGDPEFHGVIHEKMLAIYACAGKGLKAEEHLWGMRLAGKEPERGLIDIVLALCASEKNTVAVQRLLAGTRTLGMTLRNRKRTFSWLLRGFIKGGHFDDASNTLISMLDQGINPERLDRSVVLQGLRKSLQKPGYIELYLDVCKRLSDKELVGPCIVYLHINAHKLWIMKTL